MSSYRHIVLFNWKQGTPESHVGKVIAALATLPSKIPQIKNYKFGPDLGVNPGNYQFVVAAEFESIEDYLVYRDHPDHRAFIAEFTAPFVETRAAIQYEI